MHPNALDIGQPLAVLAERRWANFLMVLPGVYWLWWGTDRYAHAGPVLRILLALGSLVWGAALFRALVGAMRPSRLVFAAEGLRYEHWFRTRSWLWEEISDIKGKDAAVTFMDHDRHMRLVTLDLRSKAFQGGRISGIQIAREMRKAQDRWTPLLLATPITA